MPPRAQDVVFLTFLGGGAFGNDVRWIVDAVAKARPPPSCQPQRTPRSASRVTAPSCRCHKGRCAPSEGAPAPLRPFCTLAVQAIVALRSYRLDVRICHYKRVDPYMQQQIDAARPAANPRLGLCHLPL